MTDLSVQTVITTLTVAGQTSTQLVANLDPPLVLEVGPSGATLSVQVVQAGVLVAPAAQGPVGPQGKQGEPGSQGQPGPIGASGRTLEIEVEATGGAQAVVVPAPFGAVQSLFRNGLRERMSSFSTVSNVVTLPSFTEAGDIISILYFPS